MTRLHPDDIQAIAERVVSLLAPSAAPAQPVSPALMMIQLARQGRIAESKQIPKSMMKRRAS